ncbi:MAG: DinB family protein, partial [Bacteroidota bacterium]
LFLEILRNNLFRYFQKERSSIFEELYPIEVFGYTMTESYFLIHLLGHLNYHTGQINYHRRILSQG